MDQIFNDYVNPFMTGLNEAGMFQNIHQQQWGQQQQQQPSADNPPPASVQYINDLKPKPVTADDVQEANNKECLICLDEHTIGSMAVKLPCGHLFHKPCVVEWLQKHCTCPVCRYEVQSNDPRYEAERRKRMQKTRKMRIRYDELQSKRVAELRTVCTQLGVNISDCIDKKEIIDKICDSGKVEVMKGVPQLEIPQDKWDSIGVKELMSMLKDFGLSADGALMKSELRNKLLESERIVVIPSIESKTETTETTDTTTAATAHAATVVAAAISTEIGVSGMGMEEEDAEGTNSDIHADADADTGESPIEAQPQPQEEKCVYPPSSSSTPPVPTPAVSTSSSYANTSASGSVSTSANTSTTASTNTLELGLSLLSTMSVRELKSIMLAYNISTANCLERSELLDRMRSHPGITLIDDR